MVTEFGGISVSDDEQTWGYAPTQGRTRSTPPC